MRGLKSLQFLAVISIGGVLGTSCNSTGNNLTQMLSTATTKPATAEVKPDAEKPTAQGSTKVTPPAADKPAAPKPPSAPQPTAPAVANNTVLAASDTHAFHAGRTNFPSMVGSNLLVRTTAYCHMEKDSLPYGKKNAAGGTLQYGSTIRSAAADWSRFPVGTRFKIHGQPQEFIVDDYGSALVGSNTIDIYKPSIAAMNEWGVRHVPIEIIEWGSFERSRVILDGRKHVEHADHVRQMLKDINARYSSGHHPALPRSA